MSALESIFGDVISRYTRQQAIEDGFLVDLMRDDLCLNGRRCFITHGSNTFLYRRR